MASIYSVFPPLPLWIFQTDNSNLVPSQRSQYTNNSFFSLLLWIRSKIRCSYIILQHLFNLYKMYNTISQFIIKRKRRFSFMIAYKIYNNHEYVCTGLELNLHEQKVVIKLNCQPNLRSFNWESLSIWNAPNITIIY